MKGHVRSSQDLTIDPLEHLCTRISLAGVSNRRHDLVMEIRANGIHDFRHTLSVLELALLEKNVNHRGGIGQLASVQAAHCRSKFRIVFICLVLCT